jgi:DNA-directed RNA polymerase subunit RPC12/RpoP
MRSNCTECGSSLTIKEAIQYFCSNCGRSLRTIPAHSQRNIATGRKNFDLLVARELKKKDPLSFA